MKATLVTKVTTVDPDPALVTNDEESPIVLFVDGGFYTIHCDKHPRYRAEMYPTAEKCEVCKVMWILRKAARKMKEDR